jgi:hypothetical protein
MKVIYIRDLLIKMSDFYKVGGSLRYGHPTYITRKADRDIYDALKQKEFCYVLNSRQMGKSSLRVRTMKTLAQEGFKCVAIDLGILGRFTTAEQWYGGLLAELWRRLRLTSGMDDDLYWWRSHLELSPVQRFSRFIEDVLLVNCTAEIIIFLDEVDNIINLDFRDEFLILIRNCYEKRVELKHYQRLTFCLLGVATPSNLRIDKQLSPFNIGKAIQLTGFNFTEAQPLISGLNSQFSQPELILQEILHWTKGQPFLTQKLCSLIVRYGEPQQLNIPQLIQHYLVDNWEIQDEPEHLKTIRDRLLHNQQNKARLLTLYHSILNQQEIIIDGSDEQVELRLSGLVTRQQSQLKVSNPIYKRVFNQQWVAKQLAAISPYQNALAAWLQSDRQDPSRLLRGEALVEGQVWARKHSISNLEKDFLHKSELMAIEEQRQAELARKAEFVTKQLAQEKRLVRWQRLFILFSLAMITGFYLESRRANFSNISALIQSSTALSASNQKLDGLIAAIKAKQKLNKSLRVNQDLTQQVDTALQQVVYEIKEKNRLLGHSDRLYDIAISNDGKLMATAATDNTVRLWKKDATGWQPHKVLKGHDGWVVDVAISPIPPTPLTKGKIIASASRDRTVKLWNQNGKLINTLSHPQAVNPINNQIVSASEDKTVKVWNLNGHLLQTLQGHQDAVRTVITNGKQIISGSEDRSIKIWDLAGRIVTTLEKHQTAVKGISVSPNQQYLASVDDDGKIILWQPNNQTWQPLQTLQGHNNSIWSVTFSPDSQTLATAGEDAKIILWNLNNIRHLNSLQYGCNWIKAYLQHSPEDVC